MKRTTINTSGLLAFWSAKGCDRAHLGSALGPYADMMPPPRGPLGSLKMACRDYAELVMGVPRGDVLVNSLSIPSINGVEVRQIEHQVLENAHRRLFSARYVKDTEQVFVTFGLCYREKLLAYYQKRRSELTGEGVGALLKSLACNACGGFAVREAGGIYWIPNTNAEQWMTLVGIVERITGSSVVSGVLDDSPSAIKVLNERLLASIKSECDEINQQVSDGLQHSAAYYEKRKQVIKEVFKKVKAAEESMGEDLKACREVVEKTEEILFRASLMNPEFIM